LDGTVCDGGWIEVMDRRWQHLPSGQFAARADIVTGSDIACSNPKHGDDCIVALIESPAVAHCPVCHVRPSAPQVPSSIPVDSAGEPIPLRLPYADT
jgi:hypothetical protein